MSVYLHLVKRGLRTKCFRAALFAFLGSYHEYERETLRERNEKILWINSDVAQAPCRRGSSHFTTGFLKTYCLPDVSGSPQIYILGLLWHHSPHSIPPKDMLSRLLHHQTAICASVLKQRDSF